MLTYVKRRDTVTVQLSGELDHYQATRLRGELDALLADKSILHLIFDMKNLTFMDSSGIGIIIGRYRVLSRRGGRVSIRNARSSIDRIINMSGLYQIIKKIG